MEVFKAASAKSNEFKTFVLIVQPSTKLFLGDTSTVGIRDKDSEKNFTELAASLACRSKLCFTNCRYHAILYY